LSIGTITDGDIRRGLLRGLDLSGPVDGIIKMDPRVAPPQMSTEVVLHLMGANKIHQLPIVDHNRRVVGLHLRDAFVRPEDRPNMMAIMAGGRGRNDVFPPVADERASLIPDAPARTALRVAV
jgi:hypothetical protein